jgi:hypothetical protein
MSFDSQLIHSCTIERDLTSGENLFGNGLTGQDPQLVYSGACRLHEKDEKTWSSEKNAVITVTVLRLWIKQGVLVLEKDRVKSVTLEDGSVLTDAFTIKKVLPRRNVSRVVFQTLELERTS